MCFGNATTKTVNTSNTPDPRVTNATAQNLDWLQSAQAGGMPALPDNRVADFGPLQNQGFDLAATTAANPDYLSHAQDLVNQYSSAPAGHILTNNISQGIQPYMDQFDASALDPQLRDNEEQRNAALRSAQGAATMSGAFGDPRAAIDQDLVNRRYDQSRQGLISNAYNQAFDRALGASAQDVSNSNNAQTANAGLKETALNRAQSGAGDLMNLQSGQVNLANILNSLGMGQTAQTQAKLNVPFQDWMIQNMQWMPQIAQLLNQTASVGTKSMPSTGVQTTSAPDNSGLGALGSIAGSLMGPTLASAGTGIASGLSSMLPFLAMSDIELKENIEPLTELWDGTPVWSYNYIDDPTPQIGLMAQDIEDRVPEAVHDFGDYKAVDYEMATRPARRAFLADAFGLAA